MKTNFFFAFFVMAFSLFSSCKKEAGIGGDASIKGRLWVHDYNTNFTTLIGEFPGRDLYVYIVFGNHTGFDRRLKTDYKGEFEFRYLYPGDYKVYAYSIDSTFTDISGTVAVMNDVTITERKESKDLGDILIFQ